MTDIDSLLKQAEIQQHQMKLELQFQKNMALFKLYAPDIYNKYLDYHPEKLNMYYDDGGFLNLVNVASGTHVYDRNPEDFCNDQFTAFKHRPAAFQIGFNPAEEVYFFQLPLLARITKKYSQRIHQSKPQHGQPVGMMVVNGLGLGYHLPKLIEEFDIYTLCIFEPHKDSFYFSLHTLDWKPILETFTVRGRMLKMFIGMDDESAMTSIRLMTNRVGLHNICNTYFYSHLSSQKGEEFSHRLKNQFHLALTGTGFLEDEQVSVAHTIENLNTKTPVLNSSAPMSDLPPAIIVGNGPSLDYLIEPLRELCKDAVVFSCGTSTGTLYRNGIVPDFHIEMERLGGTGIRIINGTDPDYRSKVKLLALNTVAPETMALFDQRYMAKKANDGGEQIIDTEMGEHMPFLNACNPTCTNTGLSFALQMGFTELYLFGVDLGMIDKDKHHASDSQYYDDGQKPIFASSERRVDIRREGNFGGEVITTAMMDTSRANMEHLLRFYPFVKVYNPNEGAKIKGVKPLCLEELSVTLGRKREGIVDELVERHFTVPPSKKALTEERARHKYLTGFYGFKKILQLPEDPGTINQLQQTLDDILLHIHEAKDKDRTAYWLLTGSMQSFFTLMMKSCLSAPNQQEFLQTYLFCKKAYDEFVQRAYEMMRNRPLKHHDIDSDFSELALEVNSESQE